MVITIAIVGRPNVGKSTLFNKLCGRRLAITDDQSGVTRDAKAHNIKINDTEVRIIDTAGLSYDDTELQKLMVKNALEIAKQSDFLLLMVDAKVGILADDVEFASKIRKLGKKVILLANKAEGKKIAGLNDFYRLGFGEPIYISAEHNLGFEELYEVIFNESKKFKTSNRIENSPQIEEDKLLKVAIVGRPNVGKSTLFNSILGFERSIVSTVAGTTRDAINHIIEIDGRLIELIDTAGMRKKRNIDDKLETLAVRESITALRRAHIILFVIDVTRPLEKQDLAILSVAIKEGKAVVLIANKIDLIKDKKAFEKELKKSVEDSLYELKDPPLTYISAKLKKNIMSIFNATLETEQNWNKEISTAKLNQWLKWVVQKKQAPLGKNNRRLKLKYIVQSAVRPPTFSIFCNLPSSIPESYKRYLYNELYKEYGFSGVPIRLRFRKSDNPYK